MVPVIGKEAGYAVKGQQDSSWPLCPNCKGFGQISQELAIGGALGVKGDTCSTCNGVGRVHDPSWRPCGCNGQEECPACHGLGLLSPQAHRELKDRLSAAQATADAAGAHFRALKAASRGAAPADPPQA